MTNTDDATTDITPRNLTGEEIARLARHAEQARTDALVPGDLYGAAGQWSIVRETRPWADSMVIDHDPMMDTTPPEPWAAGVTTGRDAIWDRIPAADVARVLASPTTTSQGLIATHPLLTDSGAREITPADRPDARALLDITEEGANVSRDEIYIYESALAALAADGSVARALAVRLDLRGDHRRDLATGDYEICEVAVDATFGVVAIARLEQGFGSWAQATERAEALLLDRSRPAAS